MILLVVQVQTVARLLVPRGTKKWTKCNVVQQTVVALLLPACVVQQTAETVVICCFSCLRGTTDGANGGLLRGTKMVVVQTACWWPYTWHDVVAAARLVSPLNDTF